MLTLDWNQLSTAARAAALARPARANAGRIAAGVSEIIAAVRRGGDAALRELTARFEGCRIDRFEVDAEEFDRADASLTASQHEALETAIGTVRAFHSAQAMPPVRVETAPGVVCERIVRPIQAVGLYVPAGSAPLPSTAIMLSVPAVLAGCPQPVMCTPAGKAGNANASILAAARKAGIERVFKVGGAQAIAAMAYGTASIPKCDKIFGPGNAWVTSAKQQVGTDPDGAALDLPAGVSEVMVIADRFANAEFVAADLLAQAEHGADAHALLISDSREFAALVAAELAAQAPLLSRTEILSESVAKIRLIVCESLAQAVEIANRYAAEHLILEVREPRRLLPEIANAGAIFLGDWSPESIGDYCGGPNHTLPTYGFARAYSGLGLEDFQKRISVQELSREGLRALGPTACVLAELEGLDAHAATIARRIKTLDAAVR